MSFKCQTFGKWILAGEHAVLRGHPALVFPVYSHSMTLEWQESSDPVMAEFEGVHGKEYRLLFWGVVEDALGRLEKSRSDLMGKITLTSSLPVGAGLGASAALCVAVSQWLSHLGWVAKDELYEFSRTLEDLFHGESSGVDIAVALAGEPIAFTRTGERESLIINWKPQWYLSFCGQRGVTSECVNKVKNLFKSDLKKAEKLDLQMAEAVGKARMSLQNDAPSGFGQLLEAIRLGESCFERWNLIDGSLSSHIKALKEAGALACKPTGSGGGGYVLSLWQEEPPENLKAELIRV